MSFIETITWPLLVNKIYEVKDRIYLSLPGIDEEIAQCLANVKSDKNVLIHVCIDNSEDVIRNGFGEVKAIELLLKNNINIQEKKGNRISFFIIDDSGFLIFPESRIFSADPTGPNAVRMDSLTLTRLVLHFFPSGCNDKERLLKKLGASIDNQNELIEEIRDEITGGGVCVSEGINLNDLKIIETSLENNPPLHPNLQRQIKTYSAKIQMIDFSFSGAKLNEKKVQLPPRALPLNNERLMEIISSTLKLFNDVKIEDQINDYKYVLGKIKHIREVFLTPLTSRERKNVFNSEKRKDLQTAIDEVVKKIPGIKNAIIKLVEREKLKRIYLLKIELAKFYSAYPPARPRHLENMPLNDFIEDYISGVIVLIKFPPPNEVAEMLNISAKFYDFTWEDFQDKELLKELKAKRVMSGSDFKEILSLKEAFEVRA